MSIRTGLLPGIALLILLFTGCATTREADVVEPGCRVLPTTLRFIDSRIGGARLEQDRSACYFEGTASSQKVADDQKNVLVALASSRCGATIVEDAPDPTAKERAEQGKGVQMRMRLVQSAPDNRCSLGGAVGPDLAGDEYEIQVTAQQPGRYPPAAYRQDREGQTVVIVLLDDQFELIGAVVETSSGYEDFDEAALTAAREWRFTGRTSRLGTVFVRLPFDFKKN